MLVLQILIVPILVILLLSTIFVTASLGLEKPRHLTRDDQSAPSLGDSDSTEPDDKTLLGTPFVKI